MRKKHTVMGVTPVPWSFVCQDAPEQVKIAAREKLDRLKRRIEEARESEE
jgi:hypothetical protein